MTQHVLTHEVRHWKTRAHDLRDEANDVRAEMGDDLMGLYGADTIDIAAARRAFETAAICMTAALQRLDAHLERNGGVSANPLVRDEGVA